ncbi:hypothetical protein LCGC14_1373210 [marine sediment metagenome]|uniref:Uncharacterized protein n=1 Tax=marine sediment metagenome TaxID=412755 RepID=A0A0F9KQW3_9ZZZZ
MAYSTCARVSSLLVNLLNGASDFDNLAADVVPGSAAYIGFMSSGCSIINATLQVHGYSVPVASSNGLFDYLADVEANYAAYRAEMSRSSPRTATGERSRADMFKRVFDDGIKFLSESDLTELGISKSTTDWYIGGRTDSDKSVQESDRDLVQGRFARGRFSNPNVAISSQTAAAS